MKIILCSYIFIYLRLNNKLEYFKLTTEKYKFNYPDDSLIVTEMSLKVSELI